MGLRALSEELHEILSEGTGSTATPCLGCGSMQEMVRRLAEQSGLDEAVLTEAMKCDSECRKKYTDADGSFKGKNATGQEFSSCEKMFEECCKGVKDPKALCAYIGRKAGQI